MERGLYTSALRGNPGFKGNPWFPLRPLPFTLF